MKMHFAELAFCYWLDEIPPISGLLFILAAFVLQLLCCFMLKGGVKRNAPLWILLLTAVTVIGCGREKCFAWLFACGACMLGFLSAWGCYLLVRFKQYTHSKL